MKQRFSSVNFSGEDKDRSLGLSTEINAEAMIDSDDCIHVTHDYVSYASYL